MRARVAWHCTCGGRDGHHDTPSCHSCLDPPAGAGLAYSPSSCACACALARACLQRGAVKTAMTKLNSTEVKDNARPSWVYLSQAGTIANKVSLADLLKMDLEAKQNKLSGIEE